MMFKIKEFATTIVDGLEIVAVGAAALFGVALLLEQMLSILQKVNIKRDRHD